jgi:hypothetical protein
MTRAGQAWRAMRRTTTMPRMHIETPIPTATRIVRARRGITVAAATVACAALMSACGSSSTSSTATTNVNTRQVAASIEQSILSKRHLHSTVTCPAAVAQEKGKTFVCIATTHSGTTVSKTPFKVTVENSKGYVTYVGE